MNRIYQKALLMVETSQNPGQIETTEKFIEQAKTRGYLNLSEQDDLGLLIKLKKSKLTTVN